MPGELCACYISLVLTTTQHGMVILQTGTLTHGNVHLPKVTELGATKLGFRPSQFGSKAVSLTSVLKAAY